jgi:hypothetical protein
MSEQGQNWKAPSEKTAQGFTRAKYITAEDKETFLDAVREGVPLHDAARLAGTSTTQITRLSKREPEFAQQIQEAMREGRPNYDEQIRAGVHHQAFKLENYKAVRDLALIYLSEWEALRTQRFGVEIGNMGGEAFKLAAIEQFKDLPPAVVSQIIDLIESGQEELKQGQLIELPRADDG